MNTILRHLSLRTRVLGTLVLLLLLSAAGPGAAWLLFQQQHRQDAAVLNEAGRQRMRIQRMVALSQIIAQGRDDKREELRRVAARFEQTMNAFQEGGSALDLPTAPRGIRPQLTRAESRWEAFWASLETILDKGAEVEPSGEEMTQLWKRGEALLEMADQTVEQYEAASAQNVKRIQFLLAGSVVGLLGVIGLFLIFADRHVARPLARLRREAEAIADGHFDQEVTEVAAKDEIGSLTRSVRRMKDRLVRSFEKIQVFRTAVENAGHCIYWTDAEGTIEYVNPAFERVTGFSREETVGRTPGILSSGVHDSSFYEDLWGTITEGKVWEGEVIDKRADGERVVVNQTISPVQNGGIEHFVAVGTDITEKKKYERALRNERDRLETLFQSLPTPVCHCKVRANEVVIEAVNGAFEEVFGIDGEEVRGANVDDLLVPEDCRAEAAELNVRALKEGTLETEVQRRTADGRRDFKVQVTGREREEGPPELYTIYTDITEQKEREAQLRCQNEKLEQFAGIVSHDLRNPLNVAKGRLGLVMEEGMTGEGDTEKGDSENSHLQAVDQALDRMDDIIQDVLVLTWSERELDAASLEYCELENVALECWEQVDSAAASLNIEDPPRVQASEGHLRELLENLFRNAVEHGGEDVMVTIGGLPDGFFVEDDGPGIPAEKREEVLEAGVTSTEGGTGLGLSIVRTIAEVHGWDIEVSESRKGGARFEIRNVELEEEREGK